MSSHSLPKKNEVKLFGADLFAADVQTKSSVFAAGRDDDFRCAFGRTISDKNVFFKGVAHLCLRIVHCVLFRLLAVATLFRIS